MIFGNLFLLAFIATLCCDQLDGQSVDLQSAAKLKDSNAVYDALFGLESCVGGHCAEYEVTESNSAYPTSEEPDKAYDPQDPDSQYPSIAEPEEIYEPQYPDKGDESDETSTMTYPDLCEGLLKAAAEIELQHPDVAPIKLNVLDDLIKYSSVFAEMDSDSCNPAIKLLDIIIAAAEQLRDDYKLDPHASCEYTEIPTEQPEYPTYETQDSTEEQSYETTADYSSSEGPTEKPCSEEPDTTDYPSIEQSEQPCPEEESTSGYEVSTSEPCSGQHTEEPAEEIIAEEECDEHPSPPFVGSIRGVPGEHYPNYTEIPITSFSCADKKCIPGFYADLETGCQVFHVCYEHRRESFLCPMGTIFNQPILACDYWYSSNCSLAPSYYDVNCKTYEVEETGDTAVGELVTSIVEHSGKDEYPELPEDSLDDLAKFLPVKAKVTVFTKTVHSEKPITQDVEEVASDIFDTFVSTATRVVSKTRDVIAKVPEPIETELQLRIKKPLPILKPKAAVIPVLKMKAALPKAKILGKMAVKAAVPVAKLVAAKTVIPVAKTKLAIGKKLSIKAAIPIAAKKLAAGKIIAKAAVPIVAKAKVAAAVPVAKVMAVPVVAKSKLAAGKVVASKIAVPVAAKAKLVVASKVAIPAAAKAVAKKVVPAKVAAGKVVVTGAVAAKLPIAKATAIKGPVLKTKILAASLPFAKSAILKSSLPIAKAKIAPALKAKLFKSASIPIVKGKLKALPLSKSKLLGAAPFVKAKVVKAAAISPLTKKALALGYMKLLKAKKLAFVG